MNIWNTLWQWASTHWVLVLILVVFILYVLVATLVSLYNRYGFYTWYFVFVTLALAGALVPQWGMYCIAFLLGMVTAFAEIISKFRDEPIKALGMPHALFYHLLNGAIAMFALRVLILFGVSIATPLDQLRTVVIAGLGSMLVMRSKLFNIKVGGEDVSFGPEQIIKIFFRFMEAAIDRLRAQDRIEFVKSKLGNVNPDKVFDYSVTMLLASQALEEKARKECQDGINALISGEYQALAPQFKSYRLGFLLLDNMGEDFVAKVFDDIPTTWLIEAPLQEKAEQTIVSRLPLFPSADKAKQIPYFSYGTSMCSREFRQRLGSAWQEMDETHFREVTEPKKAILKGYSLSFTGTRPNSTEPGLEHVKDGLATIVKGKPDDWMEGVVYQLNKDVIEFLDLTEPGYHREKVKVTVGGKESEAEAYVAERRRDTSVPEPEYLEYVLDGAREFDLSPEYLRVIQEAARAVKV